MQVPLIKLGHYDLLLKKIDTYIILGDSTGQDFVTIVLVFLVEKYALERGKLCCSERVFFFLLFFF